MTQQQTWLTSEEMREMEADNPRKIELARPESWYTMSEFRELIGDFNWHNGTFVASGGGAPDPDSRRGFGSTSSTVRVRTANNWEIWYTHNIGDSQAIEYAISPEGKHYTQDSFTVILPTFPRGTDWPHAKWAMRPVVDSLKGKVYIEVPHNKEGRVATLEEVLAVLSEEQKAAIEVDTHLGYPAIIYTQENTLTAFSIVTTLREAGFEIPNYN